MASAKKKAIPVTPEPKKAGRPSLYTEELGEAICEGLEAGESLLAVCRRLGLKESTVRDWTEAYEGFSAKYARAREIGDDLEFERLTELASEEPPTVKGFVDSGWVSWKRNQIDTFKWTLARKRPKKYGDKVQNEQSGEVVVRVISDL